MNRWNWFKTELLKVIPKNEAADPYVAGKIDAFQEVFGLMTRSEASFPEDRMAALRGKMKATRQAIDLMDRMHKKSIEAIGREKEVMTPPTTFPSPDLSIIPAGDSIAG